ncbi:MAG: hypothetical protein ACI814_003453, partial [Mariniblastus sp.]
SGHSSLGAFDRKRKKPADWRAFSATQLYLATSG